MMMTITRCAMRVRKRAGTRLLNADIELDRRIREIKIKMNT